MESSYLFGVTDSEIEQLRNVMDPRTFDLLIELLGRDDEYSGHTPWPYVQLENILLGIGLYNGIDRFYGKGIKQLYFGYGGSSSTYAEYYRVLGYVIYGYGNLSNNDRKRRGKRTKRFNIQGT